MMTSSPEDDGQPHFPYSCVFEVAPDGRHCLVTEYLCHEAPGRCKPLMHKCLSRCPTDCGRYTFAADGLTYHFLVDSRQGLICGVVAAEEVKRRKCFEFLIQVRRQMREHRARKASGSDSSEATTMSVGLSSTPSTNVQTSARNSPGIDSQEGAWKALEESSMQDSKDPVHTSGKSRQRQQQGCEVVKVSGGATGTTETGTGATRSVKGLTSSGSSRRSHRYADSDDEAETPTPTTPRDLFKSSTRTTRL